MTAVDTKGETYEDMQQLIKFLANRFAMKTGGDYEELVSDANMVFLRVYDSWEPGRGAKFSSYLSTCVWRQFITNHRKRMRCDVLREAVRTNYVQLHIIDKTQPGNRLQDLMESLSGDAAMVAKLVIDSPADLAKMAEGKGGHPRNWVTSIREHLRGLGWTLNRIQMSFEEVGQALV